MIKNKLSNSVFIIFILFNSFILVSRIPDISGQQYNIDPQAMQQIQEMAIQIQQMYDQLPPEQQEMAIPLIQKMMQKTFMESTLEQQEFIIQKFNQMFPPQFVEKLLPPGYK
jgi:hypothetical protein